MLLKDVPAIIKANYAIATLLLLPWLLWITDPSWLLNPAGGIDAWLYHGLFREFKLYTNEWFPGTYYATRLPWLLPGMFFYSIFPPAWAGLLLHVLFYYVCIFSFYFILRLSWDQRSSLLATIIFGTNRDVLEGLGWDYVTAPVMAYSLLCLLFLTNAPSSPHARLLLAFAGAAFSSTVLCHLTAIQVLPVIFLYLISLRRSSAVAIPNHLALLSYGAVLLHLMLGAVLVIMVLGLISVAFGGLFLFFMPQIEAAIYISKHPVWKNDSYDWVTIARWLVIPLIAYVGSFLLSFARNRDGCDKKSDFFDRLFFNGNILLITILLVLEFLGGFNLQYSYYVCFYLPFIFLAFARFFKVPEALGSRGTAVLFALTGLSVFAFHVRGETIHGILAVLSRFPYVALLSAGVGLGVLGVLVRALKHQVSISHFVSLLCLAGAVFVVNCSAGRKGNELVAASGRIEAAYTEIMSTFKGVQPKFWYDKLDPRGGEYTSLAGIFFWGYSLIGDEFPSAHSVNCGDGTSRLKNAFVVIPSTEKNAWESARQVIEGQHLHARLIAQKEIGTSDCGFTLYFVEALTNLPVNLDLTVQSNRGELVSVDGKRTKLSLPLDKWEVPEGAHKSTLVTKLESLQLETHEPRDSIALLYFPLDVKDAGTYRFCLKYTQSKGKIGFVALSEDRQTKIGIAEAMTRDGAAKIQTLEIKLVASRPFRLAISNARKPEKGSTSITIHELSVSRIDATPEASGK